MSVGVFRHANNTVAAHGAAAVTLNDSTVLPISRSLYVGTGGNIKVTMADGQVVTFLNVVSGSILPIQTQVIWSTGTTASNILALY